MNYHHLKRISPRQGTAFHLVKLGNFFVHIAEPTRLLQKIGEGHVKVSMGKDLGHIFPYYGGYMGIEYTMTSN